MRIIILGNAGSGKTTMARHLIGDRAIPCLSLDDIAWDQGPIRKPLEESQKAIERFIDQHEDWIIEGCYGDLVEFALPYCTEFRWLNPGVAACVDHCTNRPWEPDKFESPEAQQQMLETLITWVQQYESREDEYGVTRHRHLFEQFTGNKIEFTSTDAYESGI